jgi:hypothetical protein
MENKDQLNQIPEESKNETQDEKTSKQVTENVEALHQSDETQAEELIAAETTKEEKVEDAVSVEATTEEVAEPAKEEEPAPVEEKSTEVSEGPVVNETSEKEQPETTAEPEKPKEEETKVTAEIPETAVALHEIVEGEGDDHEGDEDAAEDEAHDEETAEAVKVDFNELPRNELIDALEGLVQAEDVNKIKSKVALIKVSYLKKTKDEKEQRYQSYLEDGGDKEDYHPTEDPLEGKFNQLFDIYKQKRSIFLENLEKEKVENLAKKKGLLEELKELIGSEETLKKTYDDFKDLQERWKETGMVPKNEVNNLWQNYHFLVEKFFDRVKINNELKDLDLKKNLEQKIVLCEKAEELLLETSILKSFKELQRLHEQWKELGPAPADKRDEIWDRFKSATEKINIRRREHYKKQQEDQQNNFIAKTALCEKAENLLTEEVESIREWQNMTRQFTEIFKVWKSIGPAPKKQNDEIWERFKTSLDSFYSEKKEYFGKIKDQQINNYNIKLDFCIQAEGLKDSTEWRTATRDLINLQKEWRKIGPVPRKNSDKIWKRFRSACDEFFNKKADHFANIRGEESDNLKKKEEMIKQVEESKFDGSKGENLAVLKDFQRQWTEVGFVPFKEKDRLQNAFRDAINKQLDKLNISNVEMSMANYKSRFEVIKDSPDGDRQVYRERTFIQNKLTKMQEDIMLWENNLGFLADSKKANLLKEEFEKKIDKSRKEAETLKAKLKFLDR